MTSNENVPETASPQTEASQSQNESGARHEVDPRLLDILVCPLTKGILDYDRYAQELISRQARLAYPIRDGIPIMLPEEARRIEDD